MSHLKRLFAIATLGPIGVVFWPCAALFTGSGMLYYLAIEAIWPGSMDMKPNPLYIHAPDLLEACKLFIARKTEYIESDWSVFPEFLEKVGEAIQAAVAKAEGKAEGE